MAKSTSQPRFEDQMNQLERIVEELSQSNDLEDSLTKFEEGLDLVNKAEARLKNIENRLVEIKKRFNSSDAAAEPDKESESEDPQTPKAETGESIDVTNLPF